MATIFDFNTPFGMVNSQPNIGPITPMTPMTPQPAKDRTGLATMLFALGGALRGDKDFVAKAIQLKEMKESKEKKNQQSIAVKKYIADNPDIPQSMKSLLNVMSPDQVITTVLKTMPGDRKMREDVAGVPRFVDTGERVFPDVPIPEKSATSNPLRTITMGGKVVKNIRDSELTPDVIENINKSGQVIQPLGFTEKFESSKDVDFDPIKSKYLATENIIIKTSELAQKFIDEPSSALAVGKAAQFIDGIIQNIDVGSEILSAAKDKRAYKYMQNTSTSLEGTDFTDAISKASKATGVAESRIRDLAYLFAAARGQEGRGLSDKDYENALKIVTGGVGPSGRIAVLEDVSTSLRNEFYRDINFDIATSENQAYVNKLQGLPQLPNFVNPLITQQIPGNATENLDPLGIR